MMGCIPKEWRLMPGGSLMGFILRNDNFCLWFDWWRLPPEWLIDGCYPKKWRLLPVFWWMATSANGWLMVFVLINGHLCLCFDWWRLLLVFWWITFCQNGWLMGFIPRNANICQTSNGWASSPTNVYFTIRDFIMGCYLFSGLINGLFAPSMAWLIRFASYVAWLVSFALYVAWLVSFVPSVAWLMGFYLFCGLIVGSNPH